MRFPGDQSATQQLISHVMAATLGHIWAKDFSNVPEHLRTAYDLGVLETSLRQLADTVTEGERTQRISNLTDLASIRQLSVKRDMADPPISYPSDQMWRSHIDSRLEAYISTLRAMAKISTDDLISQLNGTAQGNATTVEGWANLRLQLLGFDLPALEGTVYDCKEAGELRAQVHEVLQTGLLGPIHQSPCWETAVSMIQPLATVSAAAAALSQVMDQAGRHQSRAWVTNPKVIQTVAIDMITDIVGDAVLYRASHPDISVSQEPSLEMQATALMGLRYMWAPDEAWPSLTGFDPRSFHQS